MKLLKVECLSVEGRPDLWRICFEGEELACIHRTIFGRSPKFPAFSTIEEWPAIFEKAELIRAKNYIIWRLTRQSYHSEELKRSLIERLVSARTVKQVLASTLEAGFLNDQLWIERFVAQHKKKEGLRLVLAKLQRKGLPVFVLDAIAEEWGSNKQDEEEAVVSFLEKRCRKKNLQDFREKQKVMASLFRKGFSFDSVRQGIEKFLQNQDFLDL